MILSCYGVLEIVHCSCYYYLLPLLLLLLLYLTSHFSRIAYRCTLVVLWSKAKCGLEDVNRQSGIALLVS